MTRRPEGVVARALLIGIALLVAVGCASPPVRSTVPELDRRTVESEKPLAGTDLVSLYTQAERAYEQSRWIEAARDYRTLAEAVPDDGQVWFRLANTYAHQGDYRRAKEAYEASLTRDREQPKPWFNLATVYLLDAQAALRQAHAQMRPGDPGRRLIERRLTALGSLIHGRFEDDTTPPVARR